MNAWVQKSMSNNTQGQLTRKDYEDHSEAAWNQHQAALAAEASVRAAAKANLSAKRSANQITPNEEHAKYMMNFVGKSGQSKENFMPNNPRPGKSRRIGQ